MANVDVEANNWITALGLAIEKLGGVDGIERLACEVLGNGTVIARDAATGAGFVVQATVEAVPRAPVDRPEDDELIPTEEAEIFDVEEETEEDRLRAIDAADDTREACALALRVAQEIVLAESGSIILDRGDVLKFIAVSGPHSDTLLNVELAPGTGVAGYSIERRRSVVLGNANRDPRHFGEVDQLTGANTREIACIPIMDDSRVYGVLELLNLPIGERFSRDDMHQLQGVARVLAARLARS